MGSGQYQEKEKYILFISDPDASQRLIEVTLQRFTQEKEILIVPEKIWGPSLDFLSRSQFVLTVTNNPPMQLVDYIICVCKANSTLSLNTEKRAAEESKLLIKVVY